MNFPGSGISTITTSQSNEMRLFKGGLRHAINGADRLEAGKNSNLHDHHDKLNYERGTISRSRSVYNQFGKFQYFFGGAHNYGHR